MSEPVSSGGLILGIKYVFVTYLIPLLAPLAGATAHVLEEIRTQGWKGWIPALSSGFVAWFAGALVYSFALQHYPAYAGGLSGIGGFFGVKSINVLVKVLKLATKEL